MGPSAIQEELIRCYEERTEDEKGRETTRKISLMYHRDVPQFRTPFLFSCIQIYKTWLLFNRMPPTGSGWMNERAVICEILQLLDKENQDYEAWEREKESARK